MGSTQSMVQKAVKKETPNIAEAVAKILEERLKNSQTATTNESNTPILGKIEGMERDIAYLMDLSVTYAEQRVKDAQDFAELVRNRKQDRECIEKLLKQQLADREDIEQLTSIVNSLVSEVDLGNGWVELAIKEQELKKDQEEFAKMKSE